MKHILWLLKWVLKAAIFFTLFAFALNNQQDTTVHFFFGNQWRAPQVLVVLSAFSVGVVVGVLGMLPRWLRQRTPTPPVDTQKPEPNVARPQQVAAPSYADGI
jgi:putative membrane protein